MERAKTYSRQAYELLKETKRKYIAANDTTSMILSFLGGTGVVMFFLTLRRELKRFNRARLRTAALEWRNSYGQTILELAESEKAALWTRWRTGGELERFEIIMRLLSQNILVW